MLSDAYTHLSSEDRQALLHQGSGSPTISAYVEIIFDNSDLRIPTSNSETTIRRTIGLTKDEYSVDGKTTTKAETMSLLESAGFSRSNPYYIVPQGRITALTNAKDEDRLQVLKEVAGAQVYENRREESLKLINDTNQKKERIDESLKTIDERLGELQDEIKELKEYQSLDREKRCIDFTLLDRELQEVNDNLDLLDSAKLKDIETTDDVLANQNKLDEQVIDCEKQMLELKHRVEMVQFDKTALKESLDDKISLLAQLELKYGEFSDQDGHSEQVSELREAEMIQLKSRIKNAEAELVKLAPELEAMSQQEEEVRQHVADLETSQHILQLKKSQATRFKSKSDRDEWYSSQISQLEDQIVKENQVASDITTQLDELSVQLKKVQDDLSSKRKELEATADGYRASSRDLNEARTLREKLIDERKLLWREESRIDFALDRVNETLVTAEKAISETIPRAISMGLSSVRKIADKMGLSGVYGPLCDLIEIDDMYKLALEVTAGTSLFHIVVDTDETASTVMEVLSKENGGRATFMPLNRLSSSAIKYPEGVQDAIPLISKIRYDKMYEAAVNHVFGKALVCMNLEAGRAYARSHKLNAITLQGDRIDSKGILTGGYHDNKRSRLDAARMMKAARDEYLSANALKLEIQAKVRVKDQEITLALSEIQKCTQQKQKYSDRGSELSDEVIVELVKEEARINEVTENKRALLLEVNEKIRTLSSQIQPLRSDMDEPFTADLSEKDESQLDQITRQLPALRSELQALNNRKLDIKYQKSSVEAELNESLYLQRDQLETRGFDKQGEADDANELLKDLPTKITMLKSDIKQLKTEHANLEAELETIQKSLSAKTALLSDLNYKMKNHSDVIHEQQKTVELGVARRSLLSTRKAELNQKIRELGILPDDAYYRFKDVRSRELLVRLREVTDQLKKFMHVNKKAVEQFESFTRQRADFEDRRAELAEAGDSIEDLLGQLDLRKDESILRSFKQVAMYFSEIFKRLVPAGSGSLIMQKKTDSPESRDDAGDFIGVSMKVTFTSDDEQLRIEQLSGGQKTLCALALIFAIQQSDPAPFYLFDEIDANLDTQYRTNVAKMIRELSDYHNTQFICTTFRPELIMEADQFYGVLYQNKMSSIVSIDKEDALEFVDDREQIRG